MVCQDLGYNTIISEDGYLVGICTFESTAQGGTGGNCKAYNPSMWRTPSILGITVQGAGLTSEDLPYLAQNQEDGIRIIIVTMFKDTDSLQWPREESTLSITTGRPGSNHGNCCGFTARINIKDGTYRNQRTSR